MQYEDSGEVSLTLLDYYMPQTFCVLAEVVGSNNPTTRSIIINQGKLGHYFELILGHCRTKPLATPLL
jgi:hypothetical protein